MIIVALIGLKKCGKTTTAEALIREFKDRGYRVGGIKCMPNSTITLDTEGKDTYRHRSAGADFVISLSKGEIAFIGDTGGRASIRDALGLIPEGTEVLICEGLTEEYPGIHRILLARDLDLLEETMKVRGVGDGILALSGLLSNQKKDHPIYPVFNCTEREGVSGLVDLIIKKDQDNKAT